MKECPICKKQYVEESFAFCLDDGTQLVSPSRSNNEAPTLIMDTPREQENYANVRIAISSEIDFNLSLLENYWNRINSKITFKESVLRNIEERKSFLSTDMPSWKKEAWTSLLPDATKALTKEEFEEVNNFYLSLDKLTQLKNSSEYVRQLGTLGIPGFLHKGNPLKNS